MKALRFKSDDVFEAIDDAMAEFQELRAFARPAPAFKRSGRNGPSLGKITLREMFEVHVVLQVGKSKTWAKMAPAGIPVVGTDVGPIVG